MNGSVLYLAAIDIFSELILLDAVQVKAMLMLSFTIVVQTLVSVEHDKVSSEKQIFAKLIISQSFNCSVRYCNLLTYQE